MSINTSFDNAVLKTLTPGVSRRSFAKPEIQFTNLTFSSLEKTLPDARVARISDKEYLVTAKGLNAQRMASFLSNDNEIEVQFTDEYATFVPDDDLIKPSKAPLWVVKPHSHNVVRIQRVF